MLVICVSSLHKMHWFCKANDCADMHHRRMFMFLFRSKLYVCELEVSILTLLLLDFYPSNRSNKLELRSCQKSIFNGYNLLNRYFQGFGLWLL